MQGREALENRFGPLLSYEAIGEPIRDLYEIAVAVVEDALSPAFLPQGEGLKEYPFAVGYPLRNDFNAGTCDESDGGSVLAINACVPLLVFNACLAYSTRVDALTALPMEEDGKVVVFADKLRLPGRLGNMPKDPSRVFDLFERAIALPANKGANLAFALHLYAVALRYLAMHEVMHIVLGHTGYIKREVGLDVFLEFSSAREGALDHDFSHCLEFLADRNAIRGIAARMLDGDYRTEALETLLSASPIQDEDYMLRTIVTAVSLIFHLFPNRDESLKSPVYSHPHPYLRMQWIAMELGHEVGERVNYVESVLESMAKVGAAMISNYITPSNWKYAAAEDMAPADGGQPEFTNESYAHVLALSKVWGDKLWKGYSPLYKNDGTGRLDES